MKRYDLELAATGPVMEERQEGAFVPFSEVSGLAEQLAGATRQCGVMAELLREAIGEFPQTQSFPSRCDAALAGKLPDRQDTEWTDATTSPVAADYRELQEQHDQLQSRLKGALDLLQEAHEVMRRIIPPLPQDCTNRSDLLDRIEVALAGKQQNKPVTITETIRTAPERIWLQVGDQSHYHSEPFPEHHDEVTWCADSVVACEVPYVRADLAGKVPEQHKTNWPDKCPITRRDFFMEIDGVPTYGGPYDSYTIPEMLGTPEQPWHERELFVRRFDHDEGRWVDDEVISQRVIHDGVLDELLDLKEQQADQSGVAPQGGEPCATEPPSSSPA